MKRKLLFWATLVVSALGLRAQTDVTSTYLTNADFESTTYTTPFNPNGDRDITEPDGWTLTYSNGKTYDSSILTSTQATYSNINSAGITIPGEDRGDQTYAVRFHNAGKTQFISLVQEIVLPKGRYVIEGLFWTENQNELETGFFIGDYSSETRKKYESGNKSWKVLQHTFTSDGTTATKIGIFFNHNATQTNVAGVDNIKLSFYNPETLEDGKYYLLNVGSGQYWGAGNNWGTRASLVASPEYVTLHKQANGSYTLESQVSNGGTKYWFGGDYMDGETATALYIDKTSTDGQYYIGNGFTFFGYDGTSTILGKDLTDATSDNCKWTIVSEAQMLAILNTATATAPKDATFLIKDHNFGRNNRDAGSWERTSGSSDYTGKGGDNENLNWQKWNGNFDYNQTVSSLPNGLYQMKAQGFYRPGANDTNSTDQVAFVYAGENETPLALVSSPHKAQDNDHGFTTKNTNEGPEYYVPNSQSDASKAFSAGYYQNEVNNIVVTDGTLKIGAKTDATTGNEWTVIDNFRLYYYGPTISSTAVALPTSGNLTAGTWYYFDVVADGNYDFTTTTLSDIVYTKDKTILLEDEASVSAKFTSASEFPLTEGRYFVKSSSDQPFSVAAHTFTYELGAATLSVADGKYTQAQTFTVTFPAAVSTDPTATTALVASSTATVNSNSVALTATTGGFSLDLGSLTPNTDYAIVIPAGVFGYEGQRMNDAISLTVHTPIIFDGVYCFYDASTKSFMGRGAAWGTEAIVDKYGIPFNLVTNADGVSSLEFVDWTGVYVFKTNENGIYTDNASTGWTFSSVSGGYKMKDAGSDYYAKVDNGGYGYYVHAVSGADNATVWTLKTKAERDAIIAAYPADNIENVITASGINTTATEFVTYLGTNYNEVDMTGQIKTAKFDGSVGDWTWSQIRGHEGQPKYENGIAELWNATGTFSQTIDKANLPKGVYKVTVQGYERRKDNNASTDLYNAGYNLVSTYLAANGEQVRFTDWNEVAGKPTNTANAANAFNNGEAVNEVYVYLDGNTDLTLTVKKPNYIWDNWAIFNNFTLTRYAQTEVTMSVKASKWGTFIAPFDVTIPADVEAYTVSGIEGTSMKKDAVTTTTIPANTPVVLKNTTDTAINETFYGKSTATEDSYKVGALTGVYTAATIPASTSTVTNYVLQTQGDVQAFYKVTADFTATPYRCYLTVSSTNPVKAIFFDEDATGIEGIAGALDSEGATIFNAAGARVNGLQKGVNIIRTTDGKVRKVMVK